MKKLAYLLMALMLLIGLSVNAQTFGKPYRPQYTQRPSVSVSNQAPTVTMRSTSTMFGSGSALPQAAITGTYTADEMTSPSYGPRRVGEGDGFEDEDDPDLPENPMPIGDAVLPLMLLACAYLILRATRRRREIEE